MRTEDQKDTDLCWTDSCPFLVLDFYPDLNPEHAAHLGKIKPVF